jgi:hypothetical protein
MASWQSSCVWRECARGEERSARPKRDVLVSLRKLTHPVHRMQRKLFASLQQSVGEAAKEDADAFENIHTSTRAQKIMAKEPHSSRLSSICT